MYVVIYDLKDGPGIAAIRDLKLSSKTGGIFRIKDFAEVKTFMKRDWAQELADKLIYGNPRVCQYEEAQYKIIDQEDIGIV